MQKLKPQLLASQKGTIWVSWDLSDGDAQQFAEQIGDYFKDCGFEVRLGYGSSTPIGKQTVRFVFNTNSITGPMMKAAEAIFSASQRTNIWVIDNVPNSRTNFLSITIGHL